MTTLNICFCGKIRKIFCGYPFLSGEYIQQIIPLTKRGLKYTVLTKRFGTDRTEQTVSDQAHHCLPLSCF